MNSIHKAMWRLCTSFLALVLLISVSTQAQLPVQPRYASGQVDLNDPTRVDIALVLAVDVSSSIEPSERRFQREAYAAALSDLRVANMALGGGAGRVAIAYMEWSGTRHQRVLVPMRVMSSRAEMADFAQELLTIEDEPGDPMFMQSTAIGDALLAAEVAMATLTVPAGDYIIDISGDGIMNSGLAVNAAREHLLSLGLTVNGLPIEIGGQEPVFEDTAFQEVAEFYADCVIGGPGAFHLVARGFSDIRETLIMKLMLEMAQMQPSEKRRIAAAWNGGTLVDEAHIIPALMLQLSPPPPAQEPRSDCGQTAGPARAPFDPRR